MLFPIEEDLKSPGVVPVFPLPNCVLLPCEPFPLHIFEERYKQLTEMALSTKRLIALAHQKSEGEEIYPIAGLGKIVLDDRFANGQFNILLLGLKRIKIKQFVQEHPFRMAAVEILDDRFSATSSSLLSSLESELLVVANQFLSQLGESSYPDKENPVAFLKNLTLGLFPLGVITDIVASMMPISSLEKQMVLEEVDVIARCEKLVFVLKTYLSPYRRSPAWRHSTGRSSANSSLH